ncbi:MAG: hypothetical protein H5T93_02715 [Pseudothermotoga sp.]|uniref:hypothetical protein n=1 Tax=Pseudothermotoga sp. TaxID=2033661 RepID=UPI000746587E|nr:MAG: Uncharacterized protein XD41_1914 [Desulfonauticus sp. 38_4375]MBC7115935.1 hypothetical protein [Pseudothermotoga sp.]HBT38891.1 hypothetical protein [Pseudothermotoga sp.]HCO97860.1 hypothetical protein [Pseudothermotoga sp.]
MTENIDKVAARLGFNMCDIYNVLCNTLKEAVESFDNYSSFKASEKIFVDKLKEKVPTEDDSGFLESIFDRLILEEIKRKRDKEKEFVDLKKKLPEFDAKEFERVTTKALGILIEDGLFAYVVWLESEGKHIHKLIILSSLKLLIKINLISSSQNLREAVLNEISSSIQKTLFARQALERMLVYARYRAKSLG